MSLASPDQTTTDRPSSTQLIRTAARLASHVAALPAVSRSQQIRLGTAHASGRSWRRFGRSSAAVLAVVSLVAFFQPWKTLSSAPVEKQHQRQSSAPTVSIARPSPATTGSVILPATIRPWQTTTLHARVTGYLTVWHADLGAQVKAGEVVAELETPELDQEVTEGESQALEAAAATAQAQAELAEAEADLNVTIAQLARVKAEVELSRSQLARRERLLASRAISQEEYDTAQKDWEARTADVTAAESDVIRRRSNLKTRPAIIDARQATVKSRQANVDRLKELQAFKRIVAPFDGIVTRRTAEVGMLVAAGTEPLFQIEDMSRVRVQVQVPQSSAAQTATGAEATVSIPESAAPAVRATITRLAASIDSTNRTMLAEIELDNAVHGFQPGSYAHVTLATEQDGQVWTIPANTLQMRVEGPHVAIVGEASQVEIKRVTLGRDLGGRVMVVDGIRGDEQLIVNPSDALTSGAKVEVSNRELLAKR